MNEQFQQFFTELAQRFCNENDLSDFTYVALEVIPEFKKDFVRFFHPSLEIGNDEIQVVREFTLESTDEQPSSRPDFLLRCGSWDLIVENKIWDRNYHFDQYGVKPLLLDIGESWAGCSFELKSQTSNAHLNLFFGIDFSKESEISTITVDIHKGRNSNYFRTISQTQSSPPIFVKKPWPHLIQLKMPAEKRDEINNESDKEKQLESLKEYLNVCCSTLLTAIPKT
jgi:hypothetical protein